MSEQGKVGAAPKGHLTRVKGCFMKKILLLLAMSAVVVLLFAPVAVAQPYYGGATATPMATATASPTAMATASPTATATATPLPRTGGPPLVSLATLAASLTL